MSQQHIDGQAVYASLTNRKTRRTAGISTRRSLASWETVSYFSFSEQAGTLVSIPAQLEQIYDCRLLRYGAAPLYGGRQQKESTADIAGNRRNR
jgi:hypothetical protein